MICFILGWALIVTVCAIACNWSWFVNQMAWAGLAMRKHVRHLRQWWNSDEPTYGAPWGGGRRA